MESGSDYPVLLSGLESNHIQVTMGKNRRKLFVSAIVSGIALILGIPGLADLIGLVWNTARDQMSRAVPPDLMGFLSLVSLGIFVVITYLNWEIFLKGARKGRKGIVTVVVGIMFGAGIGIIILAIIGDIVPAA